jgi:hypothetical protein
MRVAAVRRIPPLSGVIEMPTEPHFRPWGTVTPAFWQQPVPPLPPHPPRPAPSDEIPTDLRSRIKAINAAIHADHLLEASALTAAADAHITAAYGETHPYTANIRDLRAFIAHLSRKHPTTFR